MQEETWKSLVAREPRLAKLEAEIRLVKRPSRGTFCANAWWYGYGSRRGYGFKPRLVRLIGWTAQNQELNTMEAYDIAYHYLYNLLPG